MADAGAGDTPGTPGTGRAWRVVRVLAIAWLVKLGLTVVLYMVVRMSDVETKAIDDAVRAEVARTAGGAFHRGRDGVTYYEIAGPDTAPLVVLAAGSSVPGYIWQPTFDTLKASGYRVMRYDYFGRGWSDRLEIPLTQDVYAHQLAELLDSLHVTKPIALAGLSYGGTTITSFAAAHPQRVGALVYADPAIIRGRSLPWYMDWDPLADLIMQWQSRGWAQGQFSDFLHPEKFPDWADRYRVQMTYRGFRRNRLLDTEGNLGTDMRPVLAQVGQSHRPVLVVWGRQDRTVPFTQSEAVMKALPRARLVAVDSAGHLPQWEQPAVTHGALLEFLADTATRRAMGAMGAKAAK